MEITLTGAENKINKLLKSNSLFMKRNKIEMVNLESKKDTPILTASEISELITKCESLEDLAQYESDKRQVVVGAYKKKLKELSNVD